MGKESKEKLLEHLNALNDFPNNKLVQQLRKQIKKKLGRVEKSKPIITSLDKQSLANQTRSSKLQKYHKYIRLIRDNFPDLSYNQIRKQFSKRKQGTNVSITDAVWKNQSP